MVLSIRERLIERRQMEARTQPVERVPAHKGRRAIIATESYATGASNFGAIVKQHRVARKFSQSWMAEWLDCDHTYISRLESGERRPTPEFVHHFAGKMALSRFERDQLLAALVGMTSPLMTETESARFKDTECDAVWALLSDPTRSESFRSSLQSFLAAWQATPKE